MVKTSIAASNDHLQQYTELGDKVRDLYGLYEVQQKHEAVLARRVERLEREWRGEWVRQGIAADYDVHIVHIAEEEKHE